MELLSNLYDTTAPTAMAKAPQRRSACDDCRARKVQCSGDLAGCVRCRRAGIRCSYSAPKPPGRPRKVRKVAEDDRTSVDVPQPFQQILSGGFNFGNIYGGGEGEFNMGLPFGNSADLFDESLLQSNNFNFPSFNATTSSMPPATPKSFSSISSPQPLFPWSPPDDSPLAPSTTCTGLSITAQPCSCLPAFFNSISILRTPLPASGGFSLPTILTTLRTTRSAITTSMQCHYCHSSVQSTYVCMMLLGTLLPLLLLYIENALKAISSTTGSSVTLSGGIEVELERDVWIGVAKGAVKKEFEAVMKLVDEIEGILERRHCEGTGKEKEGLGVIVRGASREDGVGEVVGRELTNRSHETGEPPFCLGLLWMIRKMGERVKSGTGVRC